MTILISHRGNTNGKDLTNENRPSYIELALKNYDCEIDIYYEKGRLYLGHDKGDYEISIDWLLTYKNKLWIHCKNFDSLNFFVQSKLDLNYFWHDKDDFTLTSKGNIWTFPGKDHDENSVVVDLNLNLNYTDQRYLGICSDYISKLTK